MKSELSEYTDGVDLYNAQRSLAAYDRVLNHVSKALIDAIESEIPEYDRPLSADTARAAITLKEYINDELFYELRKPYLREIERITGSQQSSHERQERTQP